MLNVDDVLAVTVKGQAKSQEVQMHLHYIVTSGGPAAIADFAADFNTKWGVSPVLCFNAAFKHDNTVVRTIRGEDVATGPVGSPVYVYGEYYETGPNSALDGTVGDDTSMVPTGVAANIRPISAGASSTVYKGVAGTPPVVAGERVFQSKIGFGPIDDSQLEPTDTNLLASAAWAQLGTAALALWDWTGATSLLSVRLVIPSLTKAGLIRVNLGGDAFFAYQTTVNCVANRIVGSRNTRKRKRLAY